MNFCLFLFHCISLLIASFIHDWIQQGMYSTYFVSMITTIEKLFQIKSKTTGLLMSVTEVGQISTALFLTYYAGRGHRPRWIACGKFTLTHTHKRLRLHSFGTKTTNSADLLSIRRHHKQINVRRRKTHTLTLQPYLLFCATLIHNSTVYSEYSFTCVQWQAWQCSRSAYSAVHYHILSLAMNWCERTMHFMVVNMTIVLLPVYRRRWHCKIRRRRAATMHDPNSTIWICVEFRVETIQPFTMTVNHYNTFPTPVTDSSLLTSNCSVRGKTPARTRSTFTDTIDRVDHFLL